MTENGSEWETEREGERKNRKQMVLVLSALQSNGNNANDILTQKTVYYMQYKAVLLSCSSPGRRRQMSYHER